MLSNVSAAFYVMFGRPTDRTHSTIVINETYPTSSASYSITGSVQKRNSYENTAIIVIGKYTRPDVEKSRGTDENDDVLNILKIDDPVRFRYCSYCTMP